MFGITNSAEDKMGSPKFQVNNCSKIEFKEENGSLLN